MSPIPKRSTTADEIREERERLLDGRIDRMCERSAEAMKFRMKLHGEKEGWDGYAFEEMIENVLRNLRDFVRACGLGDEREMVNEGHDVMNMIAMYLELHAGGEMDRLQNHGALLKKLTGRGA